MSSKTQNRKTSRVYRENRDFSRSPVARERTLNRRNSLKFVAVASGPLDKIGARLAELAEEK